MKGQTVTPSSRRASVSRQVELMPSTSKSPKTATVSWSRTARSTRSAALDMPGMTSGSSQSRSNDGVRNSRADASSVNPRATSTRATRRERPSRAESSSSARWSSGRSDQRLLFASPGMPYSPSGTGAGAPACSPYRSSSFFHLGSRVFQMARSGLATAKLE